MYFSREVEAFIKDFAKDLAEGNVAIFAGAGMSKGVGYVDWPELLSDIADELGLKIEKEYDLISLAQFHVNQRKSSAGLAKKILEEFSEQAEPSQTHDILARLPIRTYWTTNYDSLIEDSLKKACRVADVKHSVSQLNTSRPKRDAVVYKMHGDVTVATEAVLYKEQYERYYRTHESFVTALSGDLISKTFVNARRSHIDEYGVWGEDCVHRNLNGADDGTRPKQHRQPDAAQAQIQRRVQGQRGRTMQPTLQHHSGGGQAPRHPRQPGTPLGSADAPGCTTQCSPARRSAGR